MIPELPSATGPDAWRVLWGKWGRQAEPGPDAPVHPLICHLLDVAAVAYALWEDALPSGMRSSIAADLAVSEADAAAWLAFLAGMHDIGKGSPAFACQVAPLEDRLRGAGFSFSPTFAWERPRHGVLTADILPDLLESLGVNRRVAGRLGTVAGGHHGIFPTGPDLDNASSKNRGGTSWAAARSALFDVLRGQTLTTRTSPLRRLTTSSAYMLAGFITVADWIGSNVDSFPYAARLASLGHEPADLAAYHRDSLDRARKAVRTLGWAMPEPPPPAPFEQVFDNPPRPLQRAVADLADALTGPGIVVVEAPMGEGKTEAALMLADAWARTSGTRGVYVALPTQATSNQMFERVRDFLEKRYAGQRLDLQLLHGQAVLSAPFQELRNAAERPFTVSDVHGDGDSPSVTASEWFTHRKRGLLSPFGVGTVDQALLAALKTKHGFVRAFGLAGRTLVVDEVHAYDAYMSTLLERLIEWAGALHAPVVLLSATLPRARTERFLSCYARGAGWHDSPPALAAYPRVTWMQGGRSDSQTFQPSAPDRQVRLVRLPNVRLGQDGQDEFEIGARLRDALEGGGCAAIVCNTVGRAQAVYAALKPYFAGLASDGLPVLDLLHARFPFNEREARETRAMRRFGNPSDERVARPDRAVLVGSQLVEQSLDLDFDLLATEMAPADLVLQRSGRLHRHERPSRPHRLLHPTVWLLGPDEADGLPEYPRGTKAVYNEHVLLRSWLALRERTALRLPGDLELVVEATYGERAAPEGPPSLVERWAATLERTTRTRSGEEFQAQVRMLEPPSHGGAISDLTAQAREEDAPEIHAAHQALTRLGDESVRVVLLGPDAPEPGGHVPDLAEARALLHRSVEISHRALVEALRRSEPPVGWQRSALLRHCRPVRLDANGRAEIGLRLDPELGVVVEAAT